MIICPLLNNPDVAREFEELKNATSEKAAYHIWSLNGGNSIDKAPNGADSILFKALLNENKGDRIKTIKEKARIYSKSFIQQFGDWINSEYATLSKVDENGEPNLSEIYSNVELNLDDINITDESVFGDLLIIEQEKDTYVDEQLRNHLDESLEKQQEVTVKAEREWTEKKQQEILGETQMQLAQAFGLTRREDGSFTTSETGEIPELRVLFVNSLGNPGSIDFNSLSTIAHSLITIGLTEGDATTFNHELAHFYIRKFWNSKVVQDALNAVYKKSMGDYKTDENAKIRVEEALVDYITKLTVENLYLTGLESDSIFHKFWNGFNKLLYNLFNIKTQNVKNQLLNQVVKSFIVNEQLLPTVKHLKFLMHKGVMNQTEYQKRTVRQNDIVSYSLTSRSKFENAIGTIVNAILSKSKSYLLESLNNESGVYGNEQQIAFNKESVRIVKQFVKNIEDSRSKKDDTAEMMQKVELFDTFLKRSTEEINNVLEIMYNAKANDNFGRLLYNVDANGNVTYKLQDGSIITESSATVNTKQRAYTFDDLRYTKSDIIGFFAPVIRTILDVAKNASDYGIQLEDAERILNIIHNNDLINKIEEIELLYNNAQRIKCRQWIDESVLSRTELNDDFKNRLKINMYKWLDEQMDFGDVSIFETWIGMGSMSKSPIIRALLDLISKMQYEKDQKVHKKMLALNVQLQKAKHEMGIKYSILPFNVQKLLLQLDKYGLPTGNLISKFNIGQYKKDLGVYKNNLLFGKNGLESRLRRLKDDKGKYICQPQDGNVWKLMLDLYGNPIVPQHPDCERLVKEYLVEVEKFKASREIRRYTSKYYIDRIKTLSFTTLQAISRIEDQIQDIRKAATINDEFRPDLLTVEQLRRLKALSDERNQLSSPYNIDGTLKVPGTDEYTIADELRKWHLMCRDKIFYISDNKAYEKALNRSKNPVLFQRLFANYQINPEIWEYVELHALQYDEDDPDYIELKRLRYDRSKLLAPYKGFLLGEVAWNLLYDEKTKTIKNSLVFEQLNRLDNQISKLQSVLKERYKGTGTKYDTENGERFVLDEWAIPHNLIPGVTSWLNSDSLYTVMIREIRDRINSDPNLTPQQRTAEIRKAEDLLTFVDENDGTVVPLSIFYQTVAKQGGRTTLKTGELPIQSYVVTPNNLFSEIDVLKSANKGDYVDPRYDHARKDQESDLCVTNKYKDKRYEKYINNKHPELVKLLNDVKALMKESHESIPFLGKYDGRAALIGGRTGQILGRKWYNIPQLLRNIGEFLRREFEVVETDTDFLQDYGYSTRPDGTRIQNIPIRFVKRLDNPEYISSDVVGSALKYYEMALNYNIKTKNISKFNIILNELSKFDNYTNAIAQGLWKTAQAEVLRRIYDRQLYETKNVNNNSKNPILDEEWKRFDWVRKYVISNPASWIKRAQKMRGIFQMGMLALNITSGIISFLDPLISLMIDTATGKYINIVDLIYALYKMSPLQGNIYGNALSLGGVRSHSKASAAMLKFQLAKANTEAMSDMDQGKIMRFLSDGLTMKHFTLGDYTINTINVISTMHNYKFYKGAFYPEEEFINAALKDGISIKNAAKLYSKAVTMWESVRVNSEGDLVAISNNYGKAITEKTWNDVRDRVRSRSSIYNGIVPNIERTWMQTNVALSFVTMLRNFFITGMWERFQSYNDFQVASLDEDGNPVDRPATPKEIKAAKRNQRYYKGGINFATKMIEDGVDRAAFNYLTHIGSYLKYAMFMFTHPSKKSKYNPEHKEYMKKHNISLSDVYGMQKVFMEVSIFMLLLFASAISMRAVDDDDNKDSYIAQMSNLLLMRIAIERATFYQPSTAMEIISSPTAALSDWKRKMKIFDLMYDAVGLSDHKLDEEVKSGRYAGEERWKYNLFNALSSFGINNWYADTPEELGGGGARTLKEKGNFYKGLIKNLPVVGNIIVPSNKKKEETKKDSNDKRSHRSRENRNRRRR